MLAGTGTATEMEGFLANFEENSNLSFGHSPEGYGASDHASFYASGVPVMFFSTGAHEDYHTPFDDADKINYEGEKQILDYAYGIIVDLVNRDDNLTFQEAGPRKKTTGYGRGLKVKLGIMPDFTSSENNGLGVGGVTNGGPASKAGMQKGDRIIAIDGLEIANIYDYMNRLKKLKPGQTISVDVIRNNEKKVLVVVL
jgi:C-terminal processing protease CtpA/Prc